MVSTPSDIHTSTTSSTLASLFSEINQRSLVDAAMQYAQLGFQVFPLQANSKVPMPGWSWTKQNTRDPAVIQQWWGIYPDANIGIACGEVSGINVLDIDLKDGHDGIRSYQAIVQEEYAGPVQQTPTGGQHLLFTYRPGFINFTHKGDLGGLDMRTNNGYIVAAPSLTPDGQYSWRQGGQIVAMPEALQLACSKWSTASNTITVDAPEVPEDLVDYATLNLGLDYTEYLQVGDTTPWQNDESRAIFATAGALMRRLDDPGQVFGILADNAHAYACAERHRQHGNPADWLWKYGIGKMVTTVGSSKLDSADLFGSYPGVAGTTRALFGDPPGGESSTPGAAETATQADVFGSHPGVKVSHGVLPMSLWDTLKAGTRVYTTPPELPVAIAGLLPARTVSALVGPPGQGKTQAAIQIGTALVTQTPAFSNPAWSTPEQGACLIIDCEDDGDEFHRRIRAVVINGGYGEDHQHALSEQLGWFYPGGKDIRMVDAQGHATGVVGQIIGLLNGAPVDFIQLILGPTINLLSGDENDNAQVQALTNTWHRIYNETDVGVMGIHHTTKSATLNGARTQTSARGAGSFAGSVRAMLYLQNMTKSEAEVYGEDDHSKWCGLSLVKANGMPIFEEPVWLERDKRSAYMSYAQEQPAVGQRITDDEGALVAAVAATACVLLATIDVPISSRAFSEAHCGIHGPFGIGEQSLRQLLAKACDSGLLEHTTGVSRNGGKSYTLLPQGSVEGIF